MVFKLIHKNQHKLKKKIKHFNIRHRKKKYGRLKWLEVIMPCEHWEKFFSEKFIDAFFQKGGENEIILYKEQKCLKISQRTSLNFFRIFGDNFWFSKISKKSNFLKTPEKFLKKFTSVPFLFSKIYLKQRCLLEKSSEQGFELRTIRLAIQRVFSL